MPTLNRAPPNRTGYYVESTDAYPLPIGKLGHFTAHICCLRIMQRLREAVNDRIGIEPIV